MPDWAVPARPIRMSGVLCAPQPCVRKFLPPILVPLWLVIMLAITVAGLYLGYEKPDVALAVVFLFLIGAWLFWSSWHDAVHR